MANLSEKDLGDLHDFLAVHVMKWKRHQETPYNVQSKKTVSVLATWQDRSGKIKAFVSNYRPTSSPTDSMAILKKCNELIKGGTRIKKRKQGDWVVCKNENLDPVWATGETLELAICLFAEKLFP